MLADFHAHGRYSDKSPVSAEAIAFSVARARAGFSESGIAALLSYLEKKNPNAARTDLDRLIALASPRWTSRRDLVGVVFGAGDGDDRAALLAAATSASAGAGASVGFDAVHQFDLVQRTCMSGKPIYAVGVLNEAVGVAPGSADCVVWRDAAYGLATSTGIVKSAVEVLRKDGLFLVAAISRQVRAAMVPLLVACEAGLLRLIYVPKICKLGDSAEKVVHMVFERTDTAGQLPLGRAFENIVLHGGAGGAVGTGAAGGVGGASAEGGAGAADASSSSSSSSSAWALVAAAAGLPAAAVSGAVVAGSVAVEPSFAPFVPPTPTLTGSPSVTPTPVVTWLAAVGTVVEDPSKLSGFQIAGFVAAGIGGLLLIAGGLLCCHFGVAWFCACCCGCGGKRATGAGADVGAAAANEHRKGGGKGGPIVLGRRASTRSLSLSLAGSITSPAAAAADVDRGNFAGVNPILIGSPLRIGGGGGGGSVGGPRPSVAPSVRETSGRGRLR